LSGNTIEQRGVGTAQATTSFCANFTGSTIRLSNNDVYDNQTGFACGGGTLASAANNQKRAT
jgi:hypothetical protein